ncbi:MAG: tRNA-(ms[2]io[6]A)-hydroxylase [Cellvibrionaceae bacterium]
MTITLRFSTPNQWTETVLKNFDTFLNDHAAAEKKASGMAVSMLSHYPDREELVKAMIDLSIEEMTHFRDVVRLMMKRGLILGPDEKDPYVNQFRKHLRKESGEYFLDRLLTGGIIEARGCERFALIGENHTDPTLARFYTTLASSEARHANQFIELAELYFKNDTINTRLDELLDIEAKIVTELPFRAALH